MLEIVYEEIQAIETLMRELMTDASDAVLVKRLPSAEVLRHTESKVTDLEGLIKGLKENLLIVDALKAPTVDASFQKIVENFDLLKRPLAEGITAEEEARIVLNRFREACIAISNFLMLAKNIVEKPDPIVEEILSIRSKVLASSISDKLRESFRRSYEGA
ncbi:TPA: hypothetical protein EYP44_01950 [Candidatus Bathyarchaeota archaeon]|nr:hypothetical protein [Candidatus Bathyarchaeota archaeon]